MVGAGLRALLLRGEGVGELEGGALGCAEHPVCGDRMELSVRVQGGRVQAVRWRASGCPASMAMAALWSLSQTRMEQCVCWPPRIAGRCGFSTRKEIIRA